MSEQVRKRQRIYDLLNARTNLKKVEVIGVSLWPLSSPDIHPHDCAIWGDLRKKNKNKKNKKQNKQKQTNKQKKTTNATFHPNIGSLKTAIEEESNKMYEEFILKTCKSFRRCVDRIIEKMAVILSKFTVLRLFSYFIV